MLASALQHGVRAEELEALAAAPRACRATPVSWRSAARCVRAVVARAATRCGSRSTASAPAAARAQRRQSRDRRPRVVLGAADDRRRPGERRSRAHRRPAHVAGGDARRQLAPAARRGAAHRRAARARQSRGLGPGRAATEELLARARSRSRTSCGRCARCCPAPRAGARAPRASAGTTLCASSRSACARSGTAPRATSRSPRSHDEQRVQVLMRARDVSDELASHLAAVIEGSRRRQRPRGARRVASPRS